MHTRIMIISTNHNILIPGWHKLCRLLKCTYTLFLTNFYHLVAAPFEYSSKTLQNNIKTTHDLIYIMDLNDFDKLIFIDFCSMPMNIFSEEILDYMISPILSFVARSGTSTPGSPLTRWKGMFSSRAWRSTLDLAN